MNRYRSFAMGMMDEYPKNSPGGSSEETSARAEGRAHLGGRHARGECDVKSSLGGTKRVQASLLVSSGVIFASCLLMTIPCFVVFLLNLTSWPIYPVGAICLIGLLWIASDLWNAVFRRSFVHAQRSALAGVGAATMGLFVCFVLAFQVGDFGNVVLGILVGVLVLSLALFAAGIRMVRFAKELWNERDTESADTNLD